MRKINIISMICFVLLVGGILQAAAYDYKDSTYLRIVETKYEPYPVEPGEYFVLWLSIQNKGRDATDLTLKLEPEFPFSLDPNEKAERNFGKILSGQSLLVRYKIRVSHDAVEGDNPLKYMFKTRNAENWNEAALEVMVRTHDIVLAVESIETMPKKIRPGKTGAIIIAFKNMADSLIKNVKVRINLGGIPLAPIGSTNEKMIKWVDSNEEFEVRFNVMAEPDAASDIYKIPLELEYSDEIGNAYSRNNTISVIIGDAPDLSVNLDSSTIIQSETKGDITVKFVNKGLIDIKFLNVNIKASDSYKVISAEEVYIGNIDSDDYETADFKLFVNKASGGIIVPLRLEYMDANNDEYTKLVELTLPLYDTKEAKKLGLIASRGSGGILVFLIIVGAGIVGYRKWKKKKEKK